VLGFIVFFAVLGGFFWLSKRVSGGQLLAGRRMKVIDRVMVSRDSTIVLVQIGSRLFAVGTGKGTPTFICELSPSDFPEPADKPEKSSGPGGFWGRFARNMKANVSGAAAETSAAEEASFAEVLMQIKDPPSGAEDAGEAGHTLLREEEETSFPSRLRRPSYQVSIENMSRLSEPDNLDSRLSRKREAPRAERIDSVLDRIAKRQSRDV
jgi:flagellar biogenesis protein FliO